MTDGLLTIGEGLAAFSTTSGKLRHATTVDVSVAGSEAGVAIGVARLGVSSAWTGRVGSDEPGSLVLSRLRDDGVDTSTVITDRRASTGLLLKDFRGIDSVRCAYYRQGSAGTRLKPEDLPEDDIRDAGVLHLTGVTPGLSETAAKAVHAAIEIAGDEGVPVSFDVGYQPALWPAHEAGAVLRDVAEKADILFAGDDEAQLLGLRGSPDELVEGLADLGADQVVLRLGPRGALAELHGNRYDVPTYPVRAVDTDGADDAFVAGFLADFLVGASPERRLRTGAACRAFAASVPGEWDALPDREELKEISGRRDRS